MLQHISHSIIQAILHGFNFIKTNQLKNGGFYNWSFTTTHTPPEVKKKCLTNFANALILDVLASFDQPLLEPLLELEKNRVTQKLAQFLLQQKSQFWTFNYQVLPPGQPFCYPNDLDDTSCVLAALHKYEPNLITGATLACLTQVLTQLEKKPGGPYSTWMIEQSTLSTSTWQELDLIANNNLAYFLSLHKIFLPNLIKLTQNAIRNEKFNSKYYLHLLPKLYFLARWYKGEKKNQLAQQIVREIKTQPQLPTAHLAMGLSSLLKLNPNLLIKYTKNISLLLAQQQPDGSWPSTPLYLDLQTGQKQFFAGSPVLSTILVLEAFLLYLQHEQQRPQQMKHQKAQAFRHSVITQIQQEFKSLPTELETTAQTQLQRMLRLDQKHALITFPHHFNQSLTQPTQIKPKFLYQLARANFFGWLAYSIYDDFFDDEGKKDLLPLGNLALRTTTKLYSQVSQALPQFTQFFTQTMDTIDNANLWEIQSARAVKKTKGLQLPSKLPSYSPLTLIAEKSIGHALGPIAILTHLGYSIYDTPSQLWLEFMHHYLAARQLNDDIHDWETDLDNGHLTPVVVEIIQQAKLQKQTLKLNQQTLKSLRRVFWFQVLPTMATTIKNELQTATQALKQNVVLKRPEFFLHLLDKLETVANQTLQEQQQALEFMRAYEKMRKINN